MIHFDLAQAHRVAAANSHYYEQPTEPLYLNRVLQYHDLIYLVDGRWAITEGDTEYPMEKDDALLLTAGHHHYTRLPCAPRTRTICLHVSCEPGDREDSPHALHLPTRISARSCPQVRQYFEQIVETAWSDRPYREERLSALFSLLALSLADAREAGDPGRSKTPCAAPSARPFPSTR